VNSRFFRAMLACITVMAVVPENVSAAGKGGKWGVWLDIGRLFNLVLVAVVLIWVTRKPLARFFAGRTQAIHEELAEAQRAREEAEAKLAEFESRMSRLDDELKEIRDSAEKEAQKEYERLVAAAEKDAEKAIERSRKEIDGMTQAAQQALRNHAAELSVRLAEETIRKEITDADHQRLLAGFVTRLGEKQ